MEFERNSLTLTAGTVLACQAGTFPLRLMHLR